MKNVLKFPKGFLWGSSTSAYQVEGGINNCDWSKFKNARKACDHYHKYKKDFDLLKKLNQNAFRFSIDWSRIEPKEREYSKKEINHYRRVLLDLKKRNIKTVVTLWHWTNPLWLSRKGGWANSEVVDHFSKYTEVIVKELGDLVDIWVVLNEPMVHVGNGYLRAKFPPNKINPFLAHKAFNNLATAYKESYKIIHKKYPKAKVGIAKLVDHFDPAWRWCPLLKLLSYVPHYFYNHRFLKKIENEMDYIGVDYYFHFRIVPYPPFVNNSMKAVSDMGWEIYPEGIYWVLKYVSKFKKPIYILENGLADKKDKLRKDFIKNHLIWVHKAIKEGIKVKSYMHWSLMDNLEWDWGYKAKFGLIEINFKNLKRKVRKSALYYSNICKRNKLIVDE